MIIAYLRVSTEKQNLLNQRSEIEALHYKRTSILIVLSWKLRSGKKAGKERQIRKSAEETQKRRQNSTDFVRCRIYLGFGLPQMGL